MKIVFVFDSTYPYYTGGIETWVYNVCERLADKHEITIFTVKKYTKDNKMGVYTDINPKIKFIPVKNLNHIRILKPFVRSYVAVYNCNITVYSMRRALRKFLNKEDKYYVIALGTVFAAKTVRLIKKEFPNIAAIASCRSLHPEVLNENYPGVGGIATRMERKNLNAMDAVWTNGLDTQAALKKKGFDSEVIKNGVDFERLDTENYFDYSSMNLEENIKLVTIGTVVKLKGYYEIIDAIKYLIDKTHTEVHLIGLGKGNIERFNKYAESIGVRNQIHLLGEQRDVVKYAKSADVIACTSAGGGYGMAILESMVSQTPIVAWDTPVYRQLLKDGYSSRLVEAWNSEALAKGIKYILDNKQKTTEWGPRAREKARDFDWSKVIAEIEAALGRL